MSKLACFASLSAVGLLVACTGGPGDLGRGGVDRPITSGSGGTGQQSGNSGSGNSGGRGTGSGSTGSGSTNPPAEDDAPEVPPTNPSVRCGESTCSGTQLCVQPCCGGAGQDPCEPPPPYCIDESAEAPAGCTRTSRYYICVCG